MIVLVADDDATTRTLVATILKRAGHTPVMAQDAMQVISMAQKHHPDVIVLDVQMPAGTGVTALQNLKTAVVTSHVPVVVLSGVADREKVQQLLDLGAADYLAKPVDPDSLLGAIDRATAAH